MPDAINQQPTPPEPPVSAQPPAPTPSDGLIGMTGSMLAPEKPQIPKGIYVLTGFSALGFLFSFFNTSQNGLLFTIVLLGDLMLTIGLYLRLNIIRKILIVFASLTIIVSIGLIIGLIGLQSRIDRATQAYDAAVEKLHDKADDYRPRKRAGQA